MQYPIARPVAAILASLWLCFMARMEASAAEVSAEPGGSGLMARTWNSVTDMEAWYGDGHWRAVFSPGAPHFRYSEEHRHVWALGVERQRPDDWLAGLAYFSNSFGQPSAYAYLGRRFNDLSEQWPTFFAQASAGVIYGYKGKFKDKVALNVNGFAPGALIGVGWQFDRQSALTLHLIGDAALMIQLSWDFR